MAKSKIKQPIGLNDQQKQQKEKSGITDTPNENGFNRHVDLEKFRKHMNAFLKNDYKDRLKSVTYNVHRDTGIFNAFDTVEQVNINTFLFVIQGFAEHKRLDKKEEVETILSEKIISAQLVVFKKQGHYELAGSFDPMSLNVGYIPADDELTRLEVIYR